MKPLLLGLIVYLCSQFALKADESSIRTGNGFYNNYLVLDARARSNDKSLTADDYHKLNFGSGYIMGFMDTVSIERDFYKHELPFILPPKITVGQIALITDKYFKAHPENLHMPTSTLFYAALLEAYPNPAFKKP